MAKSALELEYQKELKRINRFIKSAEQRGFSFSTYKAPSKPKKITKKSVQALKRITPSVLYEKASYYDPISELRMTGKEGQRLIRSRAQKKTGKVRTKGYSPPSDVSDVLANIEELLTGAQSSPTWSKSYAEIKRKDRNILTNIIRGAINELGREQVAKNCQYHAALVKDLAFHICYGSSDFKWNTVEGDIAAITAILYGRTLSVDDAKKIQDIRDQVEGYEEPE